MFRLSADLGPFVETQPISAKAGKSINTPGTNLERATSVALNGTAAEFTVESSSLITTTTGAVQVVTPGGTLSSNVPFRVLP